MAALLTYLHCLIACCSLDACCVDVCGAAQFFPTQHVVLRGRCSKATLQLVGYALSSAPAQIKVSGVYNLLNPKHVGPAYLLPTLL